MHRKRACGIWGISKKVSWFESCIGRRRLTFAYSPKPGQWPCEGATGVGRGADGKVRIERMCISLPYVETFNLKLKKRFRTWTKKSLRVFCVSGFLCSMYICYEHSMYVSHIRIWLWYKLFNAQHFIVYIKYTVFNLFSCITFLNEPGLIFCARFSLNIKNTV